HNVGTGLVLQKDKSAHFRSASGGLVNRMLFPSLATSSAAEPVLYTSNTGLDALVTIKTPTSGLGYGFEFRGLMFDLNTNTPTYGIHAYNVLMTVVDDCMAFGKDASAPTVAQYLIYAHGDL